jgi:glycosyltransferase involved in cell wall biosynthesis
VTPAPRSLKILSVLPFSPRLDATHGGGKATARLLLRLAERHRLALVHLRAPGEPPADPALVARCDRVEEVSTRPRDPRRLRRRVRTLAGLAQGRPLWALETHGAALAPAVAALAARWRPDVAQVDYAVLIDSASHLSPSLPVVLVEHEPGTARALSELHSGGGRRPRLRQRADLLAWRRFDRRTYRRASTVVVFTERDREAVLEAAPGASVHVIPLGLEPGTTALDPAGEEGTIVFVGSFVHPPNLDAAFQLVREILPLVRRRHAGVKAYVVGDRPPAELTALATPDVIVTGRVEQVEPYLERAAVVVAPLRQGGGMRVKVLEALAAGKALVATPLAVAGLDVSDGRHVRLAATTAAFADAVSGLLDDPGARRALGAEARAWALEQPGWDAVAARYEQVYESVVEPG